MSIPYRICVVQDNENWGGPSTGERKDGILDARGGDGSYCAFDPAKSPESRVCRIAGWLY